MTILRHIVLFLMTAVFALASSANYAREQVVVIDLGTGDAYFETNGARQSFSAAPSMLHMSRGGVISIFAIDLREGGNTSKIEASFSVGRTDTSGGLVNQSLVGTSLDQVRSVAPRSVEKILGDVTRDDSSVPVVRTDIRVADSDFELELLVKEFLSKRVRFRVGVPLRGGLRANVGGGILIVQDRSRTFSTVPEFDPITNNRVQINGQDASRIVGRRPAFSVSGITAGAYYVFDEDNIISEGLTNFGLFQRVGLEIGVATGGTDLQTYRLGMSLFFDREATIALNFGLSFRKHQTLIGQREGNLVVNQQLNTIDDWKQGFYWGLSYGIAIGGSK